MISILDETTKFTEVGPTGQRYTKYKANCSKCGILVNVTKSNWNRTHENYKCKECNEQAKLDKRTGTRLYVIYNLIKRRVDNTSNKKFGNDKHYAGVVLCTEWLDSFDAFKSWALENGYNETLTIDRKDNSEGYTPENCRWVSQTTQCQNQNKKSTNTSGYTGIQYDKFRGKWKAVLQADKVSWMKRFDTVEEALAARNNKIKELGSDHPIQLYKDTND